MEGKKKEKYGGKKEKNDENSGCYVIARSRPPDRLLLKRQLSSPKSELPAITFSKPN